MTAKPGELKAGWSRRERDILFDWGGQGATKADSHVLHSALCTTFPADRSLVAELEARGYDISTLRFSIRRKAASIQTEGGGS